MASDGRQSGARSASSAQLVAAAAGGDATAWRAIVERFEQLLWAVARGHRLGQSEAADVVQTTWLRLVENLDRIRDPDHLGAWLATTARHESLRVIRLSGRAVPVDGETLDLTAAPDAPVDAHLLVRERDALIWQAVRQLSPACQQLLRVLMATPPPSYQEVSAALGLPVGSIGPTRGRCLAKLRSLVDAGIDVG